MHHYYYYCALITLKRSNISDISNDSSSSTLQSVKCTSGCVTHGSNNTNWSIATGDIIGDIIGGGGVICVISCCCCNCSRY